MKTAAKLKLELRVVTRARNRIAQGWSKGVTARDVQGNIAAVDAREATSWCVAGACLPMCGSGDEVVASSAIMERIRAGVLAEFTEAIPCWNDDPRRTKAEVLALLIQVQWQVRMEYERALKREGAWAWFEAMGAGLESGILIGPPKV